MAQAADGKARAVQLHGVAGPQLVGEGESSVSSMIAAAQLAKRTWLDFLDFFRL